MLESDDGWVKKGDGRITILYDAFFRLTFVRENGNLNSLVRQVSLQCIYDAHPACASVKISCNTDNIGDVTVTIRFYIISLLLYKVMDRFLVQLVLGAWCSQGALYASVAFSQMCKIVGFHDQSVSSLLNAAFNSDLKTPQQLQHADK